MVGLAPPGLDDAFDLEITTPRSGGGSGCGSNGGSYDSEDVLLPIINEPYSHVLEYVEFFNETIVTRYLITVPRYVE